MAAGKPTGHGGGPGAIPGIPRWPGPPPRRPPPRPRAAAPRGGRPRAPRSRPRGLAAGRALRPYHGRPRPGGGRGVYRGRAQGGTSHPRAPDRRYVARRGRRPTPAPVRVCQGEPRRTDHRRGGRRGAHASLLQRLKLAKWSSAGGSRTPPRACVCDHFANARKHGKLGAANVGQLQSTWASAQTRGKMPLPSTAPLRIMPPRCLGVFPAPVVRRAGSPRPSGQ
jgi:hypothetical protein